MGSETGQLSRRRFLAYFSGIGMTSTLLPGVLWAKIQEEKLKKITIAMLQEAEKLAGLEFTDSERELMVEGLNDHLEKYEKLREMPLDNSVVPAIQFNPIPPGETIEQTAGKSVRSRVTPPSARADARRIAPTTWCSVIFSPVMLAVCSPRQRNSNTGLWPK